MDIFSFITLFGGLALFLFGMNIMSQGLERVAGGKLEAILMKMTSNPFKSLLLGVGITAVIQSSSAVTVMLVGLVNSGIMQLGNTVGVIMGSNIGTTVTAWILSVIGLESDNIWVRLLKPEAFSPILALIGVMLIMSAKTSKKKDVGNIMVGFAILMYGMTFMSDAVSPLADMPEFTKMLTMFTNPLLGILTGVVLTAVIQSSSASVGILQALSLTGGITYGMAIPIIMGQNIGTCVTALISSIGVSRNAKRVSIIHILFNVMGTTVFMIIYFIIAHIIDIAFMDTAVTPVNIAIIHSVFNICTTLMLLPFSKLLVRMAEGAIKTEPEKEIAYFDERLLAIPSIAVEECTHNTNEMAEITRRSIIKAMALLKEYSQKTADEVTEEETDVDTYEDRIGNALLKVSALELSDEDHLQVSKLLHVIGDLERISDHAVNIMEAAKEINEKKLNLSESGKHEIEVITGAIEEIMGLTADALVNDNLETARRVEPLEDVMDGLIETIKHNHIDRLQTGECTIEHGFVLSDILTNYERVSDHCSNIALSVIEKTSDDFEAHQYVNQLKVKDNEQFKTLFREYHSKYSL